MVSGSQIFMSWPNCACGAWVEAIHGGDCCTFDDAERFFSYRRDGQTGRMAALIWLDPGSPQERGI